MNSTGTIVTAETRGNITRPPNLSVSAPTGIRPSEPTMTGTATSNATSDSDRSPRVPLVRNSGPSGLNRAHAQKLTANPRVAIASINPGRPAASTVRPSSPTFIGTLPRLTRLRLVLMYRSLARVPEPATAYSGGQTRDLSPERLGLGRKRPPAEPR